jgi:hypothetical protein
LYRRYLLGDYYELFELPESKDAWDGWQYHDRDDGSGILIVFRLDESTQKTGTFDVSGLDEHRAYEFETIVGDASFTFGGGRMQMKMEAGEAILIHYVTSESRTTRGYEKGG